jgi:hypothetical protein
MAPSPFAEHDKENFPFLVHTGFEQSWDCKCLQRMSAVSGRHACSCVCQASQHKLYSCPLLSNFGANLYLPNNWPILLLKHLNCSLRSWSAVSGIQFFIHVRLAYCRFIARIPHDAYKIVLQFFMVFICIYFSLGATERNGGPSAELWYHLTETVIIHCCENLRSLAEHNSLWSGTGNLQSNLYIT